VAEADSASVGREVRGRESRFSGGRKKRERGLKGADGGGRTEGDGWRRTGWRGLTAEDG
jgi:hypothetical protein